MASYEKFSLKWKDFQENINSAFQTLREDSEFIDVTLACENANQVEAHKVVLAASSPFFCNLLKKNKHVHPLIYMRGLKLEDLVAIVDFLYYGEATIYQENLDTFLNIAGELDLKGLNGGEGGSEDGGREQETSPKLTKQPTIMNTDKRKEVSQPPQQNNTVLYPSDAKDQRNVKGVKALPKDKFSGELKDLDEKVNSMMGRCENMVKLSEGRMTKAYVCQVCGKEGLGNIIKHHIETIHLEGISIPCNICDHTVRSRKTLTEHKSRYHRNNTSY